MRKLPFALLAAAAIAVPAAVIGTARAAEPAAPGIVLYDAAGQPVAILRPVATTARAIAADPAVTMIRQLEAAMPPAFPAGGFPGSLFPAGFFARQDAVLQQVMQQMQSIAAPMAAPGLIDAALGAAPGSASQVVVTSFSTGNGHSCGETVSYSYPGNGGAPHVAMRKVGTDCGAMPQMMPFAPTSARSAAPSPERIAPPRTAPDGSRLINVDYRSPEHAPPRLHG